MSNTIHPLRGSDVEMSSQLNEKQIQALRLIDCGTRMRLTHLGNTLVSRQAKSLRDLGLICAAPERWIAYDLTTAGKRAVAESLAIKPYASA
jgi:hypothetical protein